MREVNSMKISLVMATYNGAKYLNEQLDSIKNQTLKLDEVIIVDDVSTDDTSYLVEKYISNHQLNWMFIKNEKNLGYKGNFKKGLAHASGDVIFLCDQDDIWHPDKVILPQLSPQDLCGFWQKAVPQDCFPAN